MPRRNRHESTRIGKLPPKAGALPFVFIAVMALTPLAVSPSAFAAPAKAAPAGHSAAAHPAAAHPAPAHSPSVGHSISHERNPHLHGFHSDHGPLAAKDRRELHVPEEHRHLYEGHAWHEHWWEHHWIYTGEYVVWLQQHTGVGIVAGTVVTAGNVAVPNAQVWLRKPRGRAFRHAGMKHTTHTDAFGNFRMLGVHPGSYRIMAKSSAAESHEQIHIDPGVVGKAVLRL